MVSHDQTHNRRTFLKSTGVAGIAALAGCTGGGGGDGGGGEGDGGGGEGDGGGGEGDGGGGGDGGGATPGGEKDPIKIGLLFPYSGPISASGQEAKQGAQIAAEQINEEGGLNGREIQLLEQDTEASPDTAVKRARQVIQQKGAEVIVGAVSSAVTKAINQYTSTQNVPHIVTGSATPDITKNECTKTLFRVNTNLIHQQKATAELLAQRGGPKKVAGVEPDYVYGHQSWEVFKEEYPNRVSGAEFVSETFPAFLKGEYKKEIQKTLDAEPDVVHSTLYSGDMISFIKQAKQFDFFQKIDTFVAGVVPMEVTVALGEEMPDNCIGMGNSYFLWPEGNKQQEKFNEQYIEKFEQIPTLFAIDTKIALDALRAGIEQSGGTGTNDIIQGLEGLKLDTVKGPLTIRAEDHQGIQDQVPTGPLGPLDRPDLAKLYDKEVIYGFDPVVPIDKEDFADAPECSF